MSRRGGGSQRYDAKKLTMMRIVNMDNDLAPRFDDDDDRIPHMHNRYQRNYYVEQRRGGPSRGGQRGRGAQNALSQIRSHLENRQDSQLMKGEGGSSTTAKSVILNQIKVPRGATIGKDFILRSIGQYIDDFRPMCIKTEHADLLFFVEDDEAASAIRAISRRLRDPANNQPITLLAARVAAGYTALSSTDRDLIAQVLRRRYNATDHSLNLSEFGVDELLRAHQAHLPLNRNNVMMTVIDLIDADYGDITALSIKGNRMRYLDYFASLVYRVKNLKTLDLSSNQIDDQKELERLTGWPVETLFLEDNPLCSFSNADAYISLVHRIFPKVKELDGIPVRSTNIGLPALDDEVKVPPSKPGFYGNAELRSLIETFLMEFITKYDDPNVKNRRNLLNAYDESAMFSLTVENLPDANERKPFYDQQTFKMYRQNSHNVCAMALWERYREKILQKGAMDIVVAIAKLPATKHILDTFLVDVSMVTEKFICFAVQGFFRDGVETVDENSEVKYFCRNFVVAVNAERKLAVVSDMLFVSAVFAERVQRYRTLISALLKLPPNLRQPDEAPNSSTTAGTLDVSSAGSSGVQPAVPESDASRIVAMAVGGDEAARQQMVDAFCAESRMKPEWSRKCLDDQHWDYEAAGRAFVAARDKLPADAFQ